MEIIECTHCGPTPVNHRIEKLGAFLDRLLGPLNRLGGFFVSKYKFLIRWVYPDYLLLGLLKGLSYLGVGRIVGSFDKRMSYRTRVIWEEAERRGIKMGGFLFLGKPTDLLMARFGRKFMLFDALPRPVSDKGESLEWMDNKGVMRERFYTAGLKIANGGEAFSLKGALEIYRSIQKPVIVKPSEGSRSRHTTVNINTETEFLEAFKIAKQLSPWVIVEEQLEGFVYRATVIGGRVVGVMRREPPHVIGDGALSIKELVRIENSNPKRHDGIFHELELGGEAESELGRQGLTLTSVPEKGRFVSLHPKVGRSSGATNRDVTAMVHLDNIKLFEKAAEFLEDSLVGIDFIILDIAKSWVGQSRSGIIEVNSLPFIDLHHYPFEGEVRDAAGALWDTVWPETKPRV